MTSPVLNPVASPHSDAYAAAAAVRDPELWALTIADLGILREVHLDEATGRVSVTITPTYSGCPAMDTIRADVRRALARAGYENVEISTVLHPAWSTDMISDAGLDKLRAAGIAPPGRAAGGTGLSAGVACPHCAGTATLEISRFGSTPCKALRRCQACAEPFDHIKPL